MRPGSAAQSTESVTTLPASDRSSELDTVRLSSPRVSVLNVSSFPPTPQPSLSLAPFVNLLAYDIWPLEDVEIEDSFTTFADPPADHDSVKLKNKKSGEKSKECTNPKLVARFKEIKAIRRAGGTVTGRVAFLPRGEVRFVTGSDSA